VDDRRLDRSVDSHFRKAVFL